MYSEFALFLLTWVANLAIFGNKKAGNLVAGFP